MTQHSPKYTNTYKLFKELSYFTFWKKKKKKLEVSTGEMFPKAVIYTCCLHSLSFLKNFFTAWHVGS